MRFISTIPSLEAVIPTEALSAELGPLLNATGTIPSFIKEGITAINSRVMGFINHDAKYATILALTAIGVDPVLRTKALQHLSSMPSIAASLRSDVLARLNASNYAPRLKKLYALGSEFYSRLTGDPELQPMHLLLPLLSEWKNAYAMSTTRNWGDSRAVAQTFAAPAAVGIDPNILRAAYLVHRLTNQPFALVLSRVQAQSAALTGAIAKAHALVEETAKELPSVTEKGPAATIIPTIATFKPPQPQPMSTGKPGPDTAAAGNFTPLDAQRAFERAATKYPLKLLIIAEKMARLETAHFTSKQYRETGSAGMEVGKWQGIPADAPYRYGLDNKTRTWKKFIRWNSVDQFLDYLMGYIRRHKGNWARWNTLDPSGQATYAYDVLNPRIKTPFMAAIMAGKPEWYNTALNELHSQRDRVNIPLLAAADMGAPPPMITV